MSSQWSTCVASKCIDGVTVCSGSCDPDYICHTGSGETEWLLITANGYNVDKVVVYNRPDFDPGRINGATLLVSYDSAFSTIAYERNFGNTGSAVYTFNLSAGTLTTSRRQLGAVDTYGIDGPGEIAVHSNGIIIIVIVIIIVIIIIIRVPIHW